jgi:YHS domain-containing protein
MVRLVLLGIVVVVLVLIARSIFPEKSSAEQEPTEMVMDPNNGVYIPKSEAVKKSINGQEYYFSSEQSAAEFIHKQG